MTVSRGHEKRGRRKGRRAERGNREVGRRTPMTTCRRKKNENDVSHSRSALSNLLVLIWEIESYCHVLLSFLFRLLIAFEDDQLDDEDYALIAENTGIQLQRVHTWIHKLYI